YRPAPRPANTMDWERTAVIAEALDRALADSERGVRLAVLRRMQREKVPVRAETLARWLREERGDEAVAAILETLRATRASEARGPLKAVIGEKEYGPANRQRALSILVAGLDEPGAGVLLELARRLEDGPVLAEVLRQTGRYPKLGAVP